MKIVYVSDAIYPYLKGGKEKRLYEVSTRLAKKGHDVHIYTMHWWDNPSKDSFEGGVQLHALCRRYDLYNDNRRSIKEAILFGLACFKLTRVKFDILDVDHMPFFPVITAWIVCSLRRRKLYGTWHEALSRQDWVRYMGFGGNIAAIIESICIRLPYSITAASEHTRSLLIAHHSHARRVELVTPGVDLRSIKSIRPSNIACDVLYVGRLVKDKNIDKLVEAVGLIIESKPDIRCIIIGEGIERPRLEHLIKEKGLDNNIAILKPLPEADDIYSFMKSSKVFVLPSVREGYGIVALEALACDTPVITTNTPTNAAKDLVINSSMGSLIHLNVHVLAEEINKWINKGSRTNLSKFISGFDWDVQADKQVKIYTT
jgi:glycosyltransferase involved in cell wall biosynthesis